MILDTFIFIYSQQQLLLFITITLAKTDEDLRNVGTSNNIGKLLAQN